MSIATLMGAVAILAADIALLREGFRDEHAVFYICGVAPMANLVMAAALAEAVRVGRRGRGEPFWSGFVLAGGAAIAVTSGFVPLTFAQPAWLVLEVAFRVLGKSNYESIVKPGLDMVLIALSYSIPQIIIALAGGWLFRCFNVAIARGGHAVH